MKRGVMGIEERGSSKNKRNGIKKRSGGGRSGV